MSFQPPRLQTHLNQFTIQSSTRSYIQEGGDAFHSYSLRDCEWAPSNDVADAALDGSCQ